MRILGLPEQEIDESTSRSFFTYLLRMLITRAHEMARRAIRTFNNQ